MSFTCKVSWLLRAGPATVSPLLLHPHPLSMSFFDMDPRNPICPMHFREYFLLSFFTKSLSQAFPSISTLWSNHSPKQCSIEQTEWHPLLTLHRPHTFLRHMKKSSNSGQFSTSRFQSLVNILTSPTCLCHLKVRTFLVTILSKISYTYLPFDSGLFCSSAYNSYSCPNLLCLPCRALQRVFK